MGSVKVIAAGAFRRKTRAASIGVSLECVYTDKSAEVLLDVGINVAAENSYEAELLAASRAVQECMQLYTKVSMACSA